MMHYTDLDVREFLYAKSVHRIERIADTVNGLDDSDVREELLAHLDDMQRLLTLAAFTDAEDDSTAVNETDWGHPGVAGCRPITLSRLLLA